MNIFCSIAVSVVVFAALRADPFTYGQVFNFLILIATIITYLTGRIPLVDSHDLRAELRRDVICQIKSITPINAEVEHIYFIIIIWFTSM